MNATDLPDVLFEEHMCQLLGYGAKSSLRQARRHPLWPFCELPKFGRRPRWSKVQVLRVIEGGAFPQRARKVA